MKIAGVATKVRVLVCACLIALISQPTIYSMTAQQRRNYANQGIYYVDDSGACGVTYSGTSSFLSGDPLTLEFPTVTNTTEMAAAMEKFIRDSFPQSPWLAIPDFGNRFTAEAKVRNVNPMLIVSIGRQETQLGTAPNSSATYNNSFGNKGSNPPGSPETDYLIYASFESSLIGDASFTEAVHKRISGQHPSYKDVHNVYEYISVHLSGQIIYPGDTSTSYDSTMGQSIDASNVVGYFKNVESWIGEMTGLSIDGIPERNTDGGGCSGSGSGTVNADGYAFPLEDQTKRNYGGTGPICKYTRSGCHGTGSVGGKNEGAAFDLMYGGNENMRGKAVYAITDGVIFKRGVYKNIPGCYSISFRSSKDNLNYWYGHLQNPDMSIELNKPIKAGTKIAEVAGPEFGPVCHGRAPDAQPGSHLHIDRGCPGYNGGGGTCRDLGFISLMNSLWEQLPPEGSMGKQ